MDFNPLKEEFDYVGVIVGSDLSFNPGTFTYESDYEAYKDTQGKRGLKDKPQELSRLVRNIYKILMTRGMKGCYVYFVDKETERFFKSRLTSGKKIECLNAFFSLLLPHPHFSCILL